MNKLALLLLLSAPVFAQSSGLPARVPGTVGNCVKIGTNNVETDNGSACASGGGGATVFVAPSGDTTGATDSANIATALGSGGKNVRLETSAGNFYINSTISMTNPAWIECDGPGSTGTIQLASATPYVLTASWNTAGGWTTNTQGGGIRNCGFVEKAGVTPTAGGGVLLGSGTAGFYTSNFHLENVTMNGLFGCVKVQTGALSNWITGSVCYAPVSGGTGCLYYDDASPGGDNYFDIQCPAAHADVTITQADRTTFRAVKLNAGAKLVFTGAGITRKVAFVNLSIEGTGTLPTCAVDFGSGANTPASIQFVGGEIDLVPTAFCNATNAFLNGTAELVGTEVGFTGSNTLLLGSIATVSPFLYTIGSTISTCGGYQAYDTFGGTNGTILSTHVDSCFHTWSQFNTAQWPTTTQLNGNNTIQGTSSGVGSSAYLNSVVPNSANYVVSAICQSTSTGSTNTVCGPIGRGASNSGYLFANISGTCTLYKFVTTTVTAIGGSTVTCAWASGVSHTLGLQMVGTTITGLIDGAATAATATDSTYTAIGNPGFLGPQAAGAILSQFTVQ